MRTAKANTLPKTLRFTPSREDWTEAREGNATQCTLAVAVRRLHPSVTYVHFKPRGATLTFGGHHYHSALNEVAAEIIACTDARKKGTPDRSVGYLSKSIVLRLIDRTPVKSALSKEQKAAKAAREKGKARKPQKPAFRVRVAKAMDARFAARA